MLGYNRYGLTSTVDNDKHYYGGKFIDIRKKYSDFIIYAVAPTVIILGYSQILASEIPFMLRSDGMK